MPLRWNATRLDQLESAIRRGSRVSLYRRGTEYVVTAVRLTTREIGTHWWGDTP